MRKQFFTTFVLCSLVMFAFSQPSTNGPKPEMEQTQRVYRVFVNNETSPECIQARNDSLAKRGVRSRGGLLTDLGLAVATGYTNILVQKTMNAASNVLDLAVKYLSAWIHKNRQEREEWLKAAHLHSRFERKLATEICIDDFYYEPSTSGALDPMNMKFNGFGCKCALCPSDFLRPDARHPQKEEVDAEELLEFYVSCKVRQDSMGLNHIANHSKFYVEVNQLVFDTRHTSLPNDSIPGKKLRPFDFNGRKDLTFTLNVKVFSSWVNEAIMLTDNQQIGEFNIVAHIDTNDLNEDGIFVYDREKHGGKVSVTGDCFMVPRSYTGTADAPSWGTGQYRLEMTILETCNVNENWYKRPMPSKSGPIADGKPSKKMKTKWDNAKWKPEWEEMKSYRKEPSVWNSLWRSITTAYIGKDWVQELVSPLVTTVVAQEKVTLTKLLFPNGSTAGASGGTTPNSATSPMPSGGTSPKGSGGGKNQ